jgi:hypothetical protein
MSEATRRPWKVDDRGVVRAKNGGLGICAFPPWANQYQAERDANAALIVRAVNAFAPMVEALSLALRYYIPTCDFLMNREVHAPLLCLRCKAEAALKLAGEK